MASRGGEDAQTLEAVRQDAVKRAAAGLGLAAVSGHLLVTGLSWLLGLDALEFVLGIVAVPLGAAGLFAAGGLLVRAGVAAARVGMTQGRLPTAAEQATDRKERRERAVADD